MSTDYKYGKYIIQSISIIISIIYYNPSIVLKQQFMETQSTDYQIKLKTVQASDGPTDKLKHIIQSSPIFTSSNEQSRKNLSLKIKIKIDSEINGSNELQNKIQSKQQKIDVVRSNSLIDQNEEVDNTNVSKNKEEIQDSLTIIRVQNKNLKRSSTNKFPEGIKKIIKRRSTQIFHQKQAIRSSNKIEQKQGSIKCIICICLYQQGEIFKFGACQHSFCSNCLLEYIDYKIKAFEELICPQQQCNQIIDQNQPIFEKISDENKKKYLKIKENIKVMNDPNSKFCPNPNCTDKIITKIQQKQNVKCSNCKIQYCFKCLYPSHKNRQCDSSQVRVLEKNLKYKQCKKCKRIIQKNQGCNHITCVCKYQFCYICGQKWNGNSHICRQQLNDEDEETSCLKKYTLKFFIYIPVWLIGSIFLCIWWLAAATLLLIMILGCMIIAPAGITDNCCFYFLILLVFPYAFYLGIKLLFSSNCMDSFLDWFFISKWQTYKLYTEHYICS